MTLIRLLRFASPLALAVMLVPSYVHAALDINHVRIVDVTPSSFSVLWHAGEVSDPEVKVYRDAGALQEITGNVEVIRFPVKSSSSGSGADRNEKLQSERAIKQKARQNGQNKIQVRGLSPNTEYFMEISSESATETSRWPASGLESVKTMRANSFITDSALISIEMNEVDAEGWLVSASMAGAAYPVSGYAGAGASQSTAVLNLGNLFDVGGFNLTVGAPSTIIIEVIKPDGTVLTGTAEIVATNNFAVSSHYDADLDGTLLGLLEVVGPEFNTYSRGEPIEVRWVDELEGVNATISLYLDTDTLGEDGVEIATGIPEDPDGAGDTFLIDGLAVADGSYYLYALMSDGLATYSAYGTSRITFDKARLDGDGDTMSDLWELHNFDTVVGDAADDFDSDGINDGLEYFYDTNPLEINDALTALSLDLEIGTQIIGVPGMLVPKVSAFGLLQQLGSAASSIGRFDASTGFESVASLVNGVPSGDDFDLLPGEGYLLQMNDESVLAWTPYSSGRDVLLAEGVNVIALTDAQGDSFGLLNELGSDSIWSVRRIDPATSLSETAAFDGFETVGIPFPLRYGEGYIVTMKQETLLP